MWISAQTDLQHQNGGFSELEVKLLESEWSQNGYRASGCRRGGRKSSVNDSGRGPLHSLHTHHVKHIRLSGEQWRAAAGIISITSLGQLVGDEALHIQTWFTQKLQSVPSFSFAVWMRVILAASPSQCHPHWSGLSQFTLDYGFYNK